MVSAVPADARAAGRDGGSDDPAGRERRNSVLPLRRTDDRARRLSGGAARDGAAAARAYPRGQNPGRSVVRAGRQLSGERRIADSQSRDRNRDRAPLRTVRSTLAICPISSGISRSSRKFWRDSDFVPPCYGAVSAPTSPRIASCGKRSTARGSAPCTCPSATRTAQIFRSSRSRVLSSAPIKSSRANAHLPTAARSS